MKRKSRAPAKHRQPRRVSLTTAKAEREARVQRFTLPLAYAIIALSVLGGFAMSLWPHAFGLQGSNPAIGFGLAALAGFRLYALRKELRRQAD
jgi:hypothetical protein